MFLADERSHESWDQHSKIGLIVYYYNGAKAIDFDKIN